VERHTCAPMAEAFSRGRASERKRRWEQTSKEFRSFGMSCWLDDPIGLAREKRSRPPKGRFRFGSLPISPQGDLPCGLRFSYLP
jgi:hypothetical protein